jgi:hypothetical protein
MRRYAPFLIACLIFAGLVQLLISTSPRSSGLPTVDIIRVDPDAVPAAAPKRVFRAPRDGERAERDSRAEGGGRKGKREPTRSTAASRRQAQLSDARRQAGAPTGAARPAGTGAPAAAAPGLDDDVASGGGGGGGDDAPAVGGGGPAGGSDDDAGEADDDAPTPAPASPQAGAAPPAPAESDDDDAAPAPPAPAAPAPPAPDDALDEDDGGDAD